MVVVRCSGIYCLLQCNCCAKKRRARGEQRKEWLNCTIIIVIIIIIVVIIIISSSDGLHLRSTAGAGSIVLLVATFLTDPIGNATRTEKESRSLVWSWNRTKPLHRTHYALQSIVGCWTPSGWCAAACQRMDGLILCSVPSAQCNWCNYLMAARALMSVFSL